MTILYPTANNSVQCTPSTGTNYTCVDDVTLDRGDYTKLVATSADEYVSGCDDYVIGDISEGMSINSVTVYIYVGTSGWTNGNTKIKLHVTIGGNKYYSDEYLVDVAAGKYSYTWTNNPATGVPWTESDVNGMTAGYTLYVKGALQEVQAK